MFLSKSNVLPDPSIEQLKIIELAKDRHVVVDSVAGSGKTTTNLHLAQAFRNSNILLLTYNSRLKQETREKACSLGLKNLEVHSYHSLCVKYFYREAYTDDGIRKVIRENLPPLQKFNYDFIILDEGQDLTPLYYELICKLYLHNRQFRGGYNSGDDNNNNNSSSSSSGDDDDASVSASSNTTLDNDAKICLVGDVFQSIYDFQKADSRMITLAPQIFKFDLRGWARTNLSVSFRVPSEIAKFLNNVVLNHHRITGSRPAGASPRYVICDCFGDDAKGGGSATHPFKNKRGARDTSGFSSTSSPNLVLDPAPLREFRHYIKQGYKYSDFFILAPSVRSERTPVRQLANQLSNEGIPVFVPCSDEEKIDSTIIEGKVVFSTFHQVKGLERKVVLVFNFDASYFFFYKQNADQTVCPNELYVALTRALERLSIFHHYSHDYLPFLSKNTMRLYCHLIVDQKLKIVQNRQSSKARETSVTDLIRHLSSDVLEQAKGYLTIINHRKAESETRVDVPLKVQTSSGYENVSDINGTAIPAFFEYQIKQSMSIYDRFKKNKSNSNSNSNSTASTCDLSTICLLDDPSSRSLNSVGTGGGSNGAGASAGASAVSDDDLLLDRTLKGGGLTVSKLLKIANRWNCYTSGYQFKLNQIENYNWLTASQLKECRNRIRSLDITPTSEFEYPLELEGEPELANRRVAGYLDCLDAPNVYEFKCVGKLGTEHYLQLGLYMYLHQKTVKRTEQLLGKLDTRPEDYRYFLYNILDNQLDEITATPDDLIQLMRLVVRAKYFGESFTSDQKFLEETSKIKSNWLN